LQDFFAAALVDDGHEDVAGDECQQEPGGASMPVIAEAGQGVFRQAVSSAGGITDERDARHGNHQRVEREVAELVAQGLTNAEIAQRLTIAADSVKKNVTRILGKLNLRDRVQLVILLRDAQP